MECPLPQGDYFTPVKCVGGNGNRGFLLSEVEKGSLVKKIRFYFDDVQGFIQGIHVTYTDGTESGKRGRINNAKRGNDSDMMEVTLEPGETIREASLWDKRIVGSHSVRVGRITLTTTENRTFDIGRKIGVQKEYSVDVGSGYLAGFTGCCGMDLIKLGFLFLKPVQKVLISHVNFKPPPPEKIRSYQLSQSTFSGYENMNFVFNNKVERINSYCFTSSATKQFPKQLQIEAALPTIVKAGGAFGWGTQETESRQWSESTTVTLEWSLHGPLKPGESVICTATCKHGQADIDYDARVTVEFVGARHQWTFSETGTLKNSIFAFTTAEAVKSTGSTAEDLAPRGGTARTILGHFSNHVQDQDDDVD